MSQSNIISFQNHIFSWWEKNRRDLPWRQTRDPYHILVSEVMLQQTQVSRVLPKYEHFLQIFPDVFSLAKASPADVIRTWKGLGYNRRALYLQKTARAVVERYYGHFPKTTHELLKLPGIGPYTAGAIMVFAYEQDEIMVDTNIRQIITHFFFNDIPQAEKLIEKTAREILPIGKSWDWHQALMDYGAFKMKNEKIKMKNEGKHIRKPFRETNRFYRGRIIDALRTHKTQESALATSLSAYGKSSIQIQQIIDTLIRDGLIVREKELLSLPE